MGKRAPCQDGVDVAQALAIAIAIATTLALALALEPALAPTPAPAQGRSVHHVQIQGFFARAHLLTAETDISAMLFGACHARIGDAEPAFAMPVICSVRRRVGQMTSEHTRHPGTFAPTLLARARVTQSW